MEADRDILISKVFLKSVIWDNRLKSHANRKVVDKAWKEIAAEMDVEDDGLLRKKWKYLRDQFAIEIGKIPPSRSGDPGGNPEPKWPYYKSLTFLVGIVKPRTIASNLKRRKTHQENERFETVSQTLTEPTESAQTEEERASDTDSEQQPSDTFCLPKKRMRNLNAKYNQRMIQLENRNAALLERVLKERRSDDSDDALFFRSLLPYVDKIPHHLKLRFRTRVQQLVDEFANPATEDMSYAPSPSSSYGGPSSNSNEQANQTAPQEALRTAKTESIW